MRSYTASPGRYITAGTRMKFFHSFVPGSPCSVLVLPEVSRFMDFSGRRLLVFCFQFSLVRQWLHVGRQFMRSFGTISHISTCLSRSTPSTSCVCHPGVALVCVWIWQTQSLAGSTVGLPCSQLQLRSPPWCRSQSLWYVIPSLPLLLS